jgi:hypothetical protein
VLDRFRDIGDNGIKEDTKTIKVVNIMVAHIEVGVLKNKVLRTYLGLGGTRYKGNGENNIMRSLMICNPHQILCG